MASLVIGAAGAGVGSLFGPLGTSIGWTLGSALGNALFGTKPHQVPHDLHIQGSSYGAFLKIIYGKVRIPGNVTWETDLQEHSGGGKGKTPGQETFTVSFRVALSETLVVSIPRFWAAGRLNYDVNQPDGPTVPFVLYDGNATQLPSPTEEAAEGVGNVPAYRGHSDVLFSDWDMTQFGNSIPQLSFELQTKGTANALSIVQRNDTVGFTMGNFPILETWPTNGTDPIKVSAIQVSTAFSVSPSTAEEFDPDTFADIAPSATTLPFPMWWSGPTPHYGPVGVYVYASGATTCLWHPDTPTQISASAATPSIITQSVYTVYNGSTYDVFDNAKFLYTAGVPVGLYLRGVALSEDGTQLFAFTSPVSGTGSTVDHWYKIVDGIVVDDGTCTPFDAGFWGMSAKPGGLDGVAHFENNGQYCWVYNPSTHLVGIYTFTAGNFADWGFGTLSVVITSGTCGGLKVIGTGRCGLAQGTAIVEMSRLGPEALTYLDEVTADLLDRGSLASTQYDVTQLAPIVVDGFVIETQMTVRAALEILMPVYFYDIVESDGVLKCVLRGAEPIVTFLKDDLAAHLDSDNLPSILSCVHTQDADLPSQLSISYMNKEADYQINTQTSQRMVGGSRGVQTVQVPLVLTDAHAKKIVDAWLFNAWWERDAYTWYSSRKYAKYEPTDVCIVQGKTLRITSKTEGATGVIKWEGVPSRAANFVQAGVGGAAFAPGQTLTPTSQRAAMLVLDVPLVRDTDEPNGIYVAMAGAIDANWRGGNLYKSSDAGTTYDLVATKVTPATMGTASGALGDFLGGNTFDEVNSVDVVIGVGGGTLVSAPALAVLNGANIALIGNELVQFRDATLIAASTYRLTGLLRGRRGTEWATAYHAAGERLVLMDANVARVPLLFSELGQSRLYKAVSFGMSLASAAAVPFTSQGRALQPYSPAHVGGGCDAAGNVTINWQRRTRIGGAWSDFADVPLSEATESYVVQIWNSAYTQIARAITTTAQTCSYTAAMQTTDFGAVQQTVFVTVTQIGAYGLGVPQKGSAPSTGGSNTASPLNPIPPYAAPPPQGGSTCPAPVTETTYSWSSPPSPNRIVNDTFAPGETWLIKFTTGATDDVGGSIGLVEFGGPPAPRSGALSASPCGPPVAPFAAFSGDIEPRIPFHVGSGNPHPGYIATLAVNTTYYFYVTTAQVSAAAVTLTH